MSDTKPDIIIEFPSWDGVGVVGYTLDATYTCEKDGSWKKKRGDIGVIGKQFVAEIKRQQAIISQYPTTFDGVPIAPGMRVYYHDHREGGQRIIWAIVSQVDKKGWANAPRFIRDGSRPLWSSEKLAAKHLADVKQEEADRYAREAAEAAKEPE